MSSSAAFHKFFTRKIYSWLRPFAAWPARFWVQLTEFPDRLMVFVGGYLEPVQRNYRRPVSAVPAGSIGSIGLPFGLYYRAPLRLSRLSSLVGSVGLRWVVRLLFIASVSEAAPLRFIIFQLKNLFWVCWFHCCVAFDVRCSTFIFKSFYDSFRLIYIFLDVPFSLLLSKSANKCVKWEINYELFYISGRFLKFLYFL